jgi:hypothetical protein
MRSPDCACLRVCCGRAWHCFVWSKTSDAPKCHFYPLGAASTWVCWHADAGSLLCYGLNQLCCVAMIGMFRTAATVPRCLLPAFAFVVYCLLLYCVVLATKKGTYS